MKNNFGCINCNKGTKTSNFLNMCNCAGYGAKSTATNSCPPKAPWWDDGKYPDFGDFGNLYPWIYPGMPGMPGYGPNAPAPENNNVAPIDSEFKPYPGEVGYSSGYHFVPYFPYFWPDEKPVAPEDNCCKCCKDEWACDGDKCFGENYYGRCRNK